ncbi:MAG: hypothetical protein E7384_02665, partial [Ruminococcaceae bacterium]|nr:hypothetical protein [Oscillospiraceae bacterium]
MISPLAFGASYSEEYTTTTPMQAEAATAGSSLNYQVFRQTDQNYGNYDPSGGAGCTIQKNGCGIMSIVNAVYHLNGNIISLKDLFTWAYSTGGYGTAGTTRYTIYPALQAAFGAKYGFSVGTMQYGKVSDATFTNHIKNGGTAIVHVYNHFMCIAGYDAASGRYLLIDPAANWDTRHSSAGGNWMTAAELTGGINSTYLTIDWYCLLSNATASGAKYTATANVAGGSGSVFFYDDVSSAKFTAGTTVFFRPVPASGYKVTSVVVNGSALAVQNSGNPSIYAFTMPSANCTINVGFSTGGAGHANATYTSAASYALPAGIVARTDSARPNSYVGLFTNATTTYSKSTAIVYYSAPAYYYISNSTAEGFTTQLQAGKMGGNCGAYGSTGTFKVVTFNTSGTAHSVNTITISGSDAHAAAITYGRGVTDNTGGGTTGGGTTSTLYTVTASVASGSGSVHFGNNVTSAQVAAGTVVNYQVTPAAGYKATKILVYGTSQTIKNNGGDAVYQFTMEAANATVSVTFTKEAATTYAVTASVASGSGTVHFGNGVTSAYAPAGQIVNYQVTPASGWKASSITVGGTAVTIQNGGADHVYQFTMPAGACAVVVKFTSIVTATDIVFDNSTTVNWAKGSVLQATTISLGTCPAGDATMVVKTSAAHNDPQFYLDYTKFGTVSASSYKYMIVTAKTSAANKAAKMYLCPGSITAPTENCATSWTWNNDGLWHDYIINLSSLSTWTGNLNQIRFDYFDGDTASGSTLYLRSIRFLTSAPSSPKVTTDKTTYKLGETITVSYSGLGSYSSAVQNIKPFVGLYKKGTSPGSTASHYWALALSSSGTLTFPDQATAGANLPSTGLAAGEYTMWIAYDAHGSSSSANLNNCKFANSGTSYNITITEATYALNASVASGSGKVHFGNDLTSTVVAPGTLINYEVSPSTGYKVSKITVNGTSVTVTNSGAAAVYQFEMPAQDTTVSVTFAKITYKITVTTPTNGTVTLKDASGNTISSGSSVAYGTKITVTATPSTGYKLSSLKAGSTSLSSGGTFTVSAATTVTATFAKKTYAITITNPTGATITLKDASGNAVASGASVAHGTVLTVTLTPSSGYRVKTVTIGGTAKKTYTTMSTTAVTYSHTVSAATTISGTAGKIYKVSFSQPTGGTIAVTNNSSGAAISSGSYVDTGTVIKVTATASTGYNLSTLKAGSTTLSSGGTYTVSAATTVSATFAKKTYKVTVSASNGTVTLTNNSTGATIASGATVEHGTVIKVTAKANTGYSLSSLKAGSTSLSSGGTFTLTAATTVTGTFAKNSYTMTITNPTGATITVKNGSTDVATGSKVAYGTSLTVTLTPSSGYRVKTVTVDGTSKKTFTTMSTTAVTYTYTVGAANFTISGTAGKIYKVSFSQPTGGTIAVTNNSSGAAISSGSYVDTGTVIKVTATASTGYNLSTLKAGSTTLSSGGTYTVSAATTVSATFAKKTYTVTISASNGTVTLKDASGNAIASGATVEHGTVITVTATPATGYKLSTLKAGSTSLSSGGTFTLTAATTVTGTFTKQSYTMTITNPTGGTITVTDASGNAVTTGTAVAYKSVLTVTLTPSSGYRVKTITVNGTSKKTNSTISSAAVTYSYTVGAAAFTLSGTCGKIYKVSYSQATGGTIAVTNNSTGAAISSGSYVDTGTVIKVSVTEATGYNLSTLKAGSTTLSNGGTYTVSAATTVAATYVKEKYTVTITTPSNGTVTLTDDSGNAIASGDSVEYGTVITVTATPSTGYKLSTLKAGSTSLSSGGTFTVSAATTVTATFTIKTYAITITNPTGGTVTVKDASGNAIASGDTVAHGSVLTVTLTPSSGYRVKTITAGGSSIKSNSTISTAAVSGTHTVTGAVTYSGTVGKIYKVTYSQPTGGTITVTNNSSGASISSGSYVDTGTVIKVTATPSTGYNLSTLKAGSTSLSSGDTYTVSAATTVSATFAKKTYKITITAPTNGTIAITNNSTGDAIANGATVEHGTVIKVTATPSTGYKLSTLKAGSTSLSSGGTYTVNAATTVAATFTAISYNVTIAVASGSGTATFADGTTATTGTIGQSISYTLTPATGYKVSKITVNGTAVTVTNSGATATYTHTMTAAETAISVTFAKKTYAVSVGEVSNGTVTLSSTGNIAYNTTITVTATPSEGYELDQILVNGTAISGTTFKVTKASTVTATFKKIQCAVSVGTVSNGKVTISPTGTVDYGTTITV